MVETSPLPKIWYHTLLTKVRAVRGFFLLTSHFERPNLLSGQSGFQVFSTSGVLGCTVSVFESQFPRSNNWVVRFIYSEFSTIIGTVGVLAFRASMNALFTSVDPVLSALGTSSINANQYILMALASLGIWALLISIYRLNHLFF